MKVFIEHDVQGTIYAIGVSAGGSGTTTLRSGPGRHVSEVEAPDVKHERDYDNLRRIKQDYRVEGGPGKVRLVRKQA